MGSAWANMPGGASRWFGVQLKSMQNALMRWPGSVEAVDCADVTAAKNVAARANRIFSKTPELCMAENPSKNRALETVGIKWERHNDRGKPRFNKFNSTHARMPSTFSQPPLSGDT